MSIKLSRHHLVLSANGNAIIPLYGPHPELSQYCVLRDDCILEPHERHSLSAILLYASKAECKKAARGVRVAEALQGRNDLFVPAHRVIHTVDVLYTGGNPLFLAQGRPPIRWHSLPLEGRSIPVAYVKKNSAGR